MEISDEMAQKFIEKNRRIRELETALATTEAAYRREKQRAEEAEEELLATGGNMPCCEKCINRGNPYKLTQETYCDHCSRGKTWKQDHYNEGPLGGIPSLQCDGCARQLPVVDGLHMDGSRTVCACTANRYR